MLKRIMGFCLMMSLTGYAAVMPTDLRCEYRVDPLGIDKVNPRLSWKITDPDQTRGQKQTGFQVLVASSVEKLNADKGDLWDSGRVKDSQSVNNLYAGEPLTSGQQCFWKVRVLDASGAMSDWSPNARFTIGLLDSNDWKGEWIRREEQSKSDTSWYRKNFKLSAKATSAMVYVASFGYHELYVNGQKITDHVMNPALSYQKKRVPYLTYDVSDYLVEGDNVIAVWHAAGWTRWARISEYRNIPFVFKAQAEIVAGGERISFHSDTSWRTKKSYISYQGDWKVLRFGGETIDDRLREDDWNTPNYDDRDWAQAVVYNADELNKKHPKGVVVSFFVSHKRDRNTRVRFSPISATLSSQIVEPQVRYATIAPVAITANKDGSYLIDMGVQYTGQLEMKLRGGSEGDVVTFETSNLRSERIDFGQKSEYIFGPSGEGLFSNRFNLAGGRWITVSGLKSAPQLEDIKGFVVTSNRKQISQFESSSELLNKIYQVNLDTYIANTIDGILVDCPHRERRGWGEVTVAAMYGDALPNFESGAYMEQYFQYQRDAQYDDGRIRGIINEADRPFLMWKANSPLTVWEAYKMLGDKQLLADNYASMQKWMEWMHGLSDYENGGALKIGKPGRREMPGLGDWSTPRGNFFKSSNSPSAAHFNNCVYAYMLDCAMKTAQALGKTQDAAMYADRLRVQQNATHELTYDPVTGKYRNGIQVNQAFALISGVTPEAERAKVMAQLEDELLYKFPYYDTGSSGQALYVRFFTEYGERMDLVYELLRDTSHPSYGYFIEEGKTTWPEHWSGVGESQIHTCYTGIGAYFIKGFGGIRPGTDGQGFKDFIIKPAPVGDLSFANTGYESLYGKIVVHWTRSESDAAYHIEVPANTTATVYLPATSKEYVKEGAQLAENADGVRYVGMEASAAVGNYVVYKVASGVYNFKAESLPDVSFPDPIDPGENLSAIGRMNASSVDVTSSGNPICEAFRANDNDLKTAWKGKEGSGQWLEIEWLKPQTFKQIVLNEIGDEVQRYAIQAWDGKVWKELATGTTIGSEKVHTFDVVTAGKCRLKILETRKPAIIAEFKVNSFAAN